MPSDAPSPWARTVPAALDLHAERAKAVTPFVLPLLLGGGAITVAFGLASWSMGYGEVALEGAITAVASGIASLALAWAWHRAGRPAAWAQPLAVLAALLGLAVLTVDHLLLMSSGKDVLATRANIMLVIVGVSAFLYSWKWLGVVIVASLASIVIGLVAGGGQARMGLAFVPPLASIPLALLIHWTRLRSHDRLVILRHDLDAALARLEEAEVLAASGTLREDLATPARTWSRGAYAVLGVPPGTAARTLDDIIGRASPADLPRLRAALQVAISGQPSQEAVARILRFDGAWAWLRLKLERRESDAGPVILATVQDATREHALRRAEEENARLASVQALVGGIAHEVNSPLMVTGGNLEIAEMELAAEKSETAQRVLPLVQDARAATARIATIVTSLRAVAEATSARMDPHDARPAIDAALERARSLAGAPEVILDARGTAPVVARDDIITEALYQLLKNAVQAQLAVGTRAPVEVETRDEEGALRIDVKDHGPGMEAKDAERVFTPLFTTREQGEGTGLALSVARARILAVGGALTFHSAPGEGTTFTLRLPGA